MSSNASVTGAGQKAPTEQAAHHNVVGAPLKDRKDIPNPGSDAVKYYTPAQVPAAGTALSDNPPKLFQPLKVGGLELHNRIMLSPLCQYSADDGHPTDWHMAHLGGIIKRGTGIAFVEATSVTPQGRITPQDTGIWKDSQANAWKKITDFVHSQNQKIGIQLAHAGRKASTVAPWISGGDTATEAVGGWPNDVWAPTKEAYSDSLPTPNEMSLDDIAQFKEAFGAAVKRSVDAGFDVIEIHNAHGYLLHEFVSPAVNKRTDRYGGSFENRTRLTMEIVELTRNAMPKGMPLFLRLSATDWLEEAMPEAESWTCEDSIELAKKLAGKIDLLDVSSGGNHPKQHIHAGPVRFGENSSSAYQAPFAIRIKEAVGDSLLVGVVGGIKDGKTAQGVLDQGLDLAIVGRMFQKNPGLVFQFADELETEVKMPNQIGWAFKGRGKK